MTFCFNKYFFVIFVCTFSSLYNSDRFFLLYRLFNILIIWHLRYYTELHREPTENHRELIIKDLTLCIPVKDSVSLRIEQV